MLFISILQIMIITFDCQKYHAPFVKYFSHFSRFPKIVLVLEIEGLPGCKRIRP
jgi:hypothetical protein